MVLGLRRFEAHEGYPVGFAARDRVSLRFVAFFLFFARVGERELIAPVQPAH